MLPESRLLSFDHVHIFPEAFAGLVAPFQYVCEGGELVWSVSVFCLERVLHADDVSSSDAVVCPFVVFVSVVVHGCDLHTVRMDLKVFVRAPEYLHVSCSSDLALESFLVCRVPCRICLHDGNVCKVTFAGRCE